MEHTPYEAAQILQAEIRGLERGFPMEFSLRYSGHIGHHNADAANKLRRHFHWQLADFWDRDWRLGKHDRTKLREFVRSERFPLDVRRQERNETIADGNQDIYRYYVCKGTEARFVPIVTFWRYLRCKLSVRYYLYEDDDCLRGGVIRENGDLDNKTKTLFDALRMPFEKKELPERPRPIQPACLCVLEDDRLVTELHIETRNKLGLRPTRERRTSVDAFIDVKIYSVHPMGNVNYDISFP